MAGVVTIKDRERKALEEIKAIVDSLGADSYVGAAFKGCFEIARDNIDNDWCCSMQDKVNTAESACDLVRDQRRKLEEELKAVKKELDGEKKQTKFLTERIRKNNQIVEHDAIKLAELRATCDQQGSEIIKLKAKLYDLMVK